MATQVAMGEAGQFADHAVDAVAEQPPGIAVGQDGKTRINEQQFGPDPLSFHVHFIFRAFPESRLYPVRPLLPGHCVPARGGWQSREGDCQREHLRNQAIWILLACLPLGPVVMSKLTRWPSAKVLKPLD